MITVNPWQSVHRSKTPANNNDSIQHNNDDNNDSHPCNNGDDDEQHLRVSLLLYPNVHFIADAYPSRFPVVAHLFVTLRGGFNCRGPEGRVPPLLPAFHLNFRLKNGGRPHHTPCEARVRVHRPCRREQPACGRTPVQYRSRIRARTRIVIAAIGDSRIPNFGWSLAPGQIHVHAPELVVQPLVLQIVVAAIDPRKKRAPTL